MCEALNKLLKERELSFQSDNQYWVIKKSCINGSGVFSTKSFEKGEIIFKDTPIVLGPRSAVLPPGCVSCMKMDLPLNSCSKGCRLPVCCAECEDSESHNKECELLRKFEVKEGEFWSPVLYRALTPFRCLLVNDRERKIIQLLNANKYNKHIEVKILQDELRKPFTEEEVNFLNHSCAVLNGTAFENELGSGRLKVSMRGLYPLAGMMNHICNPNTQRYFCVRGGIQTMVVVATRRIPEGEELTTSYCHLLWPTIVRRQFLHSTKEFWCLCQRCKDPTEFGSNLSALECPCGGLILPLSATDMKSDWKCGGCGREVPASKLPFANPALGKDGIAQPLKVRFLSINEKIEKLWNMGHKNGSYQDLTNEELDYKEKIAKELLDLNNVLQLGDSRIKGLISQEYYETLKEKKDRGLNVNEEVLGMVLNDAKKILNVSNE